MKPAEIFGIIVRTIGLLMIVPATLSGAYGLLGALMGGPTVTIAIFVLSFPLVAVGLWMLRGAPSLVEFAYPSRRVMKSTSGRVAEREFGSQFTFPDVE
jgi:hypothetical protein